MRLGGQPAFETSRTDWWGYRVNTPAHAPFDFWVLRPDVLPLGGGYVRREAEDERLGDGRSPFECDDPHPDVYYDEVWDLVIADLRR